MSANPTQKATSRVTGKRTRENSELFTMRANHAIALARAEAAEARALRAEAALKEISETYALDAPPVSEGNHLRSLARKALEEGSE